MTEQEETEAQRERLPELINANGTTPTATNPGPPTSTSTWATASASPSSTSPALSNRHPPAPGGLMQLAISLPGRRIEGIEASLAKHEIPTQRVGGALYFHDPDGLHLELTIVD